MLSGLCYSLVLWSTPRPRAIWERVYCSFFFPVTLYNWRRLWQRLKAGTWKNVVHCLVLRVRLIYLFYIVQAHLPRDATTQRNQPLLHRSEIKKIPPKTCLQVHLREAALQLRFLLPRYVQLRTKFNQHTLCIDLLLPSIVHCFSERLAICGGLSEKDTHKLIFLNTWSSVARTLGKD